MSLRLWRVTMIMLIVGNSTSLGNGPQSSFQFLRMDDQGWSIEYTPAPVPFTLVSINGEQHYLFQNGDDAVGRGHPQLPVEPLTLGIPFGYEVQSRLTVVETQNLNEANVAPVPRYEISDDGKAVAHYEKDPSLYSDNRFLPLSQSVDNNPITFRHQRLATIRLYPYRYNAADKVLQRIIRARVDVRLIRSRGESVYLPMRPASSADRFFEQTYRSMIYNYEQAKDWRGVVEEPSMDGPDPGGWFETNREYYKIPIAEDGWYKITKEDLAAAGANLSTMDTSSIRVYAKGLVIPVRVLPDSSVEFFAKRNYGDSTYLDFYTDTSAYWLTWGGAGAQRYLPVSPLSGGLSVRSVYTTIHEEQNTDYYDGLGETEITEPEAVAGEGWVWQYFYPNSTSNFDFTIDSIDYSNDTANFKIRFFGITGNFPGIDHHARFWLNDSLVGEVMFEARTPGEFAGSLPSQWLKVGLNTLRITSVPTTVVVNAFYLDWFEIEYPRVLRATNNQLYFSAIGNPSPSEFIITGFTNSSISVHDLTQGRVIGGMVTGDSTTGFAIRFSDSVIVPRSFAVVAGGGGRMTPPIRKKMFTNIRVNPQGADYVIISYRDFLPSAQQLAAHRSAVNGLRTTVIDVEDIYDEFNYGVMNATSLKAFLQYAFNSWPGSSPSYLLLLGDASWDYHGYMNSTIKKNFVPAYGVPAGDNWYGCFNPGQPFIPSMLIGRIPAEDPIQAQRTTAKIIQYDSYNLSEWNKGFMFVSGGSNPGEQLQFNAMSDNLINQYVLPPPIGGTPSRVYKAVQAVIDENNKEAMRAKIAEGIVYLNYLGHSGGRIWAVDVGDPSTLQNTNGRLPFVSSVSCNVGAFAEPSGNVLSEDFVRADNRGAVAMWASSAVGYAGIGTDMVSFFLSGVANDSVRSLGSLTTTARFRMWQISPGSSTRIASVKSNPLLGDPFTNLAIPVKSDLAVSSSEIQLFPSTPTPNDSILVVRLDLHNYGLVPADSIEISLSDMYNGQSTPIVPNLKIPPLLHKDSVLVPWDASYKVGLHTLTASLDPLMHIDEVTRANNIASADKYVYANSLAIVKPLESMVLQPGAQTLVVTSPLGLDSLGYQYFFELDTVDTFNSTFLVQSAGVAPDQVSGNWTTPSLPVGKLYFWRVRTFDGTIYGNWVMSNFSTSTTAPALPVARWRQFDQRQFANASSFQTQATDSGITIASTPPVNLYVRSVGYRGSTSQDYYSMIILNALEFFGHWWTQGNSFMGLRLDAFTGDYVYKAFNIQVQTTQADSMKKFINTTPVGDYVALAVIQDGFTNVTESLYVAIESLGSTMIRNVQPGQSWALVARKGSPSETFEQLTNDSAVVSIVVPNFYRSGEGGIAAKGLTIPGTWNSLQWQVVTPSNTDANLAIVGVRSGGGQDTLRVLSRDSSSVGLQFLNPLTSGPTYTRIRPAALLSSSDATVTPILREWSVEMSLPPDLAVSSRSIAATLEAEIQRGTTFSLPVTVYNLGFQGVDSARIIVSMYDKFNKARFLESTEVDTIAVNDSKSTTIPIMTTEFPRRVTLHVEVSPSKKYKDLVPDNNIAFYSFLVSGAPFDGLEVYADGARLMDGDYVSSHPTVLARVPQRPEGSSLQMFEFSVDKKLVAALKSDAHELSYSLTLSPGDHFLNAVSVFSSPYGDTDTLKQSLLVKVTAETRILDPFTYPNPFSSTTDFTFVLTGSEPPEQISIEVFTVAGRKVKDIVVYGMDTQVGFNRIRWDGRDNDGDHIANGTYLYRISTRLRGKQESVLQKLVRLR